MRERGDGEELRQKGNIHPQQSLLTDQKIKKFIGWLRVCVCCGCGGTFASRSNAANAITKIRVESKFAGCGLWTKEWGGEGTRHSK